MVRAFWLATGFCCLVIVLRGAPCVSFFERSATAAPPLSIDDLLDEKLPEAPKDQEELLADNSACFVCHGNFREEPMVLMHAKDDVGCVDCHGESHAHRDDEDNITPPDRMYAAADIAPGCAECHETHDAPAAKVIARWQERCPAKTNPQKLLCTDCHGKHRLPFRTVWWNKKTGELIVRKEGQRTKPAGNLTDVPAEEDGETMN